MKKIILFSFFVFSLLLTYAQGNNHVITVPAIGDIVMLNKQWIARQASYVLIDGALLSSQKQDFSNWMPATVPGTVLTSLLNNKLIPSPYYGMNNDLIPDIFHVGNDFYTYWFVNQFTLTDLGKDRHIWLNLRGINYKADLFLNGKRLSTTTHEGMFLRRSYDITDAVKTGTNTLAILVSPPDLPGEDNNGQAGDGQIARNNTMQCTAGWDWVAAVRDRNTGIWDQVALTTTGTVRMLHPQVITKVPGIRTPGAKQANAILTVNTEVENLTGKLQHIIVSYEVEKQKQITKIQLAPYEKRIVNLPQMTVSNPRLWWPHNMGTPELYHMTLVVTTDASSTTSDKQQLRFGIRDITTEKDPATGGRKFYVNGQKIFVRGGNYIVSDWMLQLSPEHYRTEVRYLTDMNLNMLRLWGGAIPGRPEFYDACDEYGMLVFQDLPISGDGNGAWIDPKKKDSQERRQQYPDNHQLFIESIIDEIKMLRNHPSLAIWCGGNEWPAPDDIAQKLQTEIFPTYDTRYLAPYSTDTLFTRNTIGGNGDGPYGIQEPEYFFSTLSSPFNPELGSIGLPEAATLRAIMDETDYSDFPKPGQKLNPVWEYHKYLPYDDQIERYATPRTTEEFCTIAQLINFEQYRALMESWASRMWTWYTGMFIWKIQNPWTALRGQMYDYNLDVNACYYGVRAGGEPLHVQYNYHTQKVEAVNITTADLRRSSIRARIYQPDGEMIHEQGQGNLNLKANTSQSLFAVETPTSVKGAYFLRLELFDGTKVISENTYWLTTQPKDYTQLQQMPAPQAEIMIDLNKKDGHYEAIISIKASDRISFFNRVSVVNRKTGQPILPVYYSDNYVTVYPREVKSITLSFASGLPQEDIRIQVKGWSDRQKSD